MSRKGRPTELEKIKKKKNELMSDVIKAVKAVNKIPLMKSITWKDWFSIFNNNGLKLSENSINHVFKRKGGARRPLTDAMYQTLKCAMKYPEKYLLLKRTVHRVETRATHCEEVGIPTPANLSLPGYELHPDDPQPTAVEVMTALKVVSAWVKINGSGKEVEFFKCFTDKIDQEKQTLIIQEYLKKRSTCISADRVSTGETPGTSGVACSDSEANARALTRSD